VTASLGTAVVESGESAQARDGELGCRGVSGSPITGSIGDARNRPGAHEAGPARGHGNSRPPLLGMCLAAPQIYNGSSSEADQ